MEEGSDRGTKGRLTGEGGLREGRSRNKRRRRRRRRRRKVES